MRALITGMSGTGKSTVAAELRSLGHRAIDLDDGWCVTRADGEWVWDEGRVDDLLSTVDGHGVVLAGCASNQGRFRERFDAVILLSAPIDLMLRRVRTRTNNPFGQLPEEIDQIVADHAEIEPILRATATHQVWTDRPLAAVVHDVLEILAAA